MNSSLLKMGESQMGHSQMMMPPEEEVQTETIVLDTGSETIKAGFGGEDAPRKEIPTLLGWPRHPGVGGVMLGMKKDNLVGSEAQEKRGLLSLRHPVQRGVVVDWDDLEKVWHHTLYCELLVAPEEHPILINHNPGISRGDKEKMAQVLFEVFNMPAMLVANNAVLSLYGTGRTTGISVDSGAGQTHIVPVWEGHAMPHNFTPMPLAGKDMTDYLLHNLRGEGYPFSTPKDRDYVQDIKESLCYVCHDYPAELEAITQSQSYEREYALPDGSVIALTKMRFHTPEAMFTPQMFSGAMADSLAGHPLLATADTETAISGALSPKHTLGKGLHELVHMCCMKCDSDIRPELFSNIALGGGNTLFPRFEERLQRGVASLAPPDQAVKVVAHPERRFGSWIGGSILASLDTFPCMWASKLEYDEFGPSILHRKF